MTALISSLGTFLRSFLPTRPAMPRQRLGEPPHATKDEPAYEAAHRGIPEIRLPAAEDSLGASGCTDGRDGDHPTLRGNSVGRANTNDDSTGERKSSGDRQCHRRHVGLHELVREEW
jgi:hypothetical protein